ncbi:MAG: hypothetical protein WB919_04740 [Candidatus Sulfotelmatobacter sp.]
MEVTTPNATRRSTRLRVHIPLTVTSLDRVHPFSAKCVALIVSAQGGGFSAPLALPLETPLLLSDLPGGGSASGRVANCLPLGTDGKQFLIGVSLYNAGNVWGIADPPDDWNCSSPQSPATPSVPKNAVPKSKAAWPYNLFSGHGEGHPGRK